MLCHESWARQVTYVTETEECGETTYLVKLLNFLNLRPANEVRSGTNSPRWHPISDSGFTQYTQQGSAHPISDQS